MSEQTKTILGEDRIPRAWYNIVADLPSPPPPVLIPAPASRSGPSDLAPLFPMALILQEVSAERKVEIPHPSATSIACGVRRRSSRAAAREGARTGARIFFKYEGVSPAGITSRTPRSPRHSTIRKRRSQASTETGAGQWGSALAFAGAAFGLEVRSTWSGSPIIRSPTGGR